ncbi:hypothetical protein ScalyP_jg1721 [Parmales sp. scaly parma]|nr:hypothetical protein ScalyP_jg1721 [Parmales sp. scaly parma]
MLRALYYISLLLSLARTTAFFPAHPASSKIFSSKLSSTSTDASPAPSKKEQKRKMMANPDFFRNGFKAVRKDAKESMKTEYESSIVAEMKTNDYLLERGDVKIYLAKDFGFCWGVERSIMMAYEARTHFPDQTMHITNELIHNPEVNDKLGDLGVQFIPKTGGDSSSSGSNNNKDFSNVGEGDVVILPAFGASFEEMAYLDKKNVKIIDTTCPWVSKVWNTVDIHQKKGLSSVIHGRYDHEETIATTSFCEEYVCVKNMDEAKYLANYILNGGDKAEFMQKFDKATSKNFDPDTHLSKVGLANQTTMYKKETRAIGQLLQKTMMSKFGPDKVDEHYKEFDTICDATQERQDAIHELVENHEQLGLDFILIVGGFDSSNTQHLLEIPLKAGVKSYHINRAECIKADNTITHRKLNGEIVTEHFLPPKEGGKVCLGVTSGASTPDASVQDCLDQIFLLKNVMSS